MMMPSLSSPAHAVLADTPIRVMVCDDSLTIRGAIGRILRRDPAIEITASVANGALAVAALERHPIDVIVLDIEMPVLDGLSALPRLLAVDRGVKIIMASTLTTRGARVAMQALQNGAADYIPKPETISGDAFGVDLLAKVKGLARLKRSSGPSRPGIGIVAASRAATQAALQPPPPISRGDVSWPRVSQGRGMPRLLAIGSSTGGPQALFGLFKALPAQLPVPVVVTQHMPPHFTASLAEHIARLSNRACAEAVHGETLRAGHTYIAPGDRHLLVQAVGDALVIRLSDEPPENSCRPAVDPMLRSASQACAGRVLTAILTGMGQDGLVGARAVQAAGGTVLAQDEESSVVWGMPGAVARDGICHDILPLKDMPGRIAGLLGVGAAVRASA